MRPIVEMEGVVSVSRSRILKVHTTRSWDFMGLTLDESNEVTPLQLAYGDDIVVGLFDSGNYFFSPSLLPARLETPKFSDHSSLFLSFSHAKTQLIQPYLLFHGGEFTT